jgi:hypothetical protein
MFSPHPSPHRRSDTLVNQPAAGLTSSMRLVRAESSFDMNAASRSAFALAELCSRLCDAFAQVR